MKRTIIFSLIALLLIGAAIAVIQNKMIQKQASAPPAITGYTAYPVATSTIATTTTRAVDARLRAKANMILSRPAYTSAADIPASIRADLERRISEATAVLQGDYNALDPWITLGLVRKALEDYDGAAEAWEFASVIRPKNYLSFQNLGFLYGSYLKDYPRAEKNYLQAISNDPGEVAAYINLADLYWYSMADKRGSIPDLLRRGIAATAASDKKIALLARLASYYEGSNDTTKAVSVIDEALVIVPGQPQLVAERTKLQAKLGGAFAQ